MHFFCVNGICNENLVEASKFSQKLQTIFPDATVELEHNATFPTAALIAIVAALVLVLIFFMFVFLAALRKAFDKVVMWVLGAGFVMSRASVELCRVQHLKTELATLLAKKVRERHEANPTRRIAIVAHSQGSDIAARALEMLRDIPLYVCGLGGIVRIPQKSQRHVVHNCTFDGDVVAQYAAQLPRVYLNPLFQGHLAAPDSDQSEVHVLKGKSHDVVDYLEDPTVQQVLALARAA